jgi:outer membrane lipoprotein carrier protein
MRSVFVWFSLLLSAPLLAGPGRTQLETFSKDVTTLKGEFAQTLFDANGRVKDKSSGAVALMAPRQFRWDVRKPFEQHIVADGNAIWVYDVDLEQVNVRAQSFDEANSPLAVLLDLAMLDVEFKVVERPKAEGQIWLRLTAKAKNPDFKYADLGFSNNTLSTMRLVDNFDQRTDIRFSNWARNAKLAASMFTFVPPKGVDVVGKPPESAVIQKVPD